MAAKETAVLNRIMLKFSKGLDRIFRNNRGVAWFSEEKPVRMGNDILLKNARAVAFGVGGDGGSDLLGWRSVVITPEMVGKRIAQFAAIEVKRPGGRATEEQINFCDKVNEAGGIAIIADSEEKITF